MSVRSEWVAYGAEQYRGYLCCPARATSPLPSIVVLQEAWGVNAHIEDVTRRFALAGYAAFAPDLFAQHHGERPAALARARMDELVGFMNEMPPAGWAEEAVREQAIAKRTASEGTRIRESFSSVQGSMARMPAFLPAVTAAAKWLREECPQARGERVFSVGFCFGGGLAALLACHDPSLAACAIFYGTPPPADVISKIECPVLAFAGDRDVRIHSQIPAFEKAMREAGKRFGSTVYKGVGHAFFKDDRPAYDAAASRDAFAQTLTLFRSEIS